MTISPSDHVLYKDGDDDVPDCITDGHGQVVLGLCRVCGRGESELSEPCTPKDTPSLAADIAALHQRHDDTHPLWTGPEADGILGGVTQSMLARWMSCRDRARLKYIHGLEPYDKWNHKLGFGNMWHVCEEAHAEQQVGGPARIKSWDLCLADYALDMQKRYPFQREDINKWFSVCIVQFPEYIKRWEDHPDVVNRTPLLQEQVFDVPYLLPSGRTVRLRGKWDSVDLIKDEITGEEGGVYLQENKTKGDIDERRVERQLKFDFQTMVYLTAMYYAPSCDITPVGWFRHNNGREYKILGVRYNVVRRPLSGGKGNISPHRAKSTKATYSRKDGRVLKPAKFTPEETPEHFYERLRKDYITKEPEYWFFRVRCEISQKDVDTFRKTCLDPLLEQVCDWYDEIIGRQHYSDRKEFIYPGGSYYRTPLNYRTPFGLYNALEEGGATEYDACLETGSEAGLRRVEELFTELK